ncbi:hypothetical protein HMPREF0091_11025 [Fannyhessea vaginae DSM 15829]|uniref:Uncharacterized protein n=1 Tax=Fannyhessea vaginae DSM 15829 TaxID=525256 RepID=F1T6C5_9ACTN|nr:hypothetical protein HMPREF0091_11025 [Fannyhessea vaginae DSM 15829]
MRVSLGVEVKCGIVFEKSTPPRGNAAAWGSFLQVNMLYSFISWKT